MKLAIVYSTTFHQGERFPPLDARYVQVFGGVEQRS